MMKVKDPEVITDILLLLTLFVMVLLNLFDFPRVALYYADLAFLVSFLLLWSWYLFKALKEEKLRLKVYYTAKFILGMLIASYGIFFVAKNLGWF